MLRVRDIPARYSDPQLIARGGMGEVYVAEDRTLGRKVAVKLLDERFAADAAVKRRFMREALAAARLSGHPHIVTIYDVGAESERPYIVMEYLPGGTLADRGRREPIAHDAALRCLREAAEALDAAHAEGIVHRDVKPANLIFDARGSLHVADFGIARVVDESTAGLTQAGSILGTAGYLSPEQARGDRASAASDIYALGIVAYELLTGGRPFDRGQETAEAIAHINDPVPPASERGVGLPKEVDPVFERALAKDPSARYGTARDFVAALGAALRPQQATQMAQRRELPLPSRPAAPPRRSRRALVALGVALAALLGGVGVVAASVLAGGDEPGRKATAPKPKTIVQTHTATVEVKTPAETITSTVMQTQTVVARAPSRTAGGTTTGGSTATPASLTGSGSGLHATGYRYMQSGDYARALQYFNAARPKLVGSSPTEAYNYYNIGYSLLRLGQCSEAIPALQESQRLQGGRPEITRALREARGCA